MVSKLIYFAFLLGFVRSCQELASIVAHSDAQVIGRGLHRSLQTRVEITSKERFSECKLVLEVEIPPEFFVDSNQIPNSVFDYEFYTETPFDVEARSSQSKHKKIYFLSKKIYRRTFKIEERQFAVPVQLRYLEIDSKKNADSKILDFPKPKVGLLCDNMKNLKQCPKFNRIYDDDILKVFERSDSIRVEHITGNLDHKSIVTTGLLLLVPTSFFIALNLHSK